MISKRQRASKVATAQRPEPTVIVLLWYVAGAITLWAFAHTMLYGSDLWWHLAAGDRMAQDGGFLFVDQWSYTFEGKPWLNDAWLSDRIYHWWITAFGLESLVWWKWGVLITAYLLLMRTLHRVTGNLLSGYIGAVMAIWTAQAFLDIRPHLYSLLGFSVLLCMTLGRDRPSWFLPLLFLVWVQLHAMFAFGLAALAVLLAPNVFSVDRERRNRSILLGLSCGLVCLVNPHFITVFTRPLYYALRNTPYRRLGEWLPPFEPAGIHSPVFPYAVGLFVVGSVILLVRFAGNRSQRVPLTGVLLGGLTLAMALKSRRFIPIFGIAQSIVIASVLAMWIQPKLLHLPVTAGRLVSYATATAALVLGLCLLWPHSLRSSAFHDMVAEAVFPRDALDFIQKNQIAGKVFAYYNWGGYLDYRTQGVMKVYIDGRADMVFDDQTYLNYVAVLSLEPGWPQIINDSGAEYFLWPTKVNPGPTILDTLLESGQWQPIYHDSLSMLLKREIH